MKPIITKIAHNIWRYEINDITGEFHGTRTELDAMLKKYVNRVKTGKSSLPNHYDTDYMSDGSWKGAKSDE